MKRMLKHNSLLRHNSIFRQRGTNIPHGVDLAGIPVLSQNLKI